MQCPLIIFIGFIEKRLHIVGLIPHRLKYIQVAHAILAQVSNHPAKFIPPFLSLSIKFPFSFDGDILCIDGINQWMKASHHHTFVTHLNKRKIVFEIIAEQQRCPCIKLNSDIASHPNTTGEVGTCREIQGTAAALMKSVDSAIDYSGIQRTTISPCTGFAHIDNICLYLNRNKKEDEKCGNFF